MREILPILLRITGAGLILLAILHVPIGRKLMWREQAARMSPWTRAILKSWHRLHRSCHRGWRLG